MNTRSEPAQSPTELVLDIIEAIACDDRPDVPMLLDDAEERLARLMSSITRLKRVPPASAADHE